MATDVQKLMDYIRDGVTYRIDVDVDSEPYIGNCSAIDEETDRETENWIRNELARGNDCAWCYVRVEARYCGMVGTDYLGGCSYRSCEDLERDLIPEMKENALLDLCSRLTTTAEILAEVFERSGAVVAS